MTHEELTAFILEHTVSLSGEEADALATWFLREGLILTREHGHG